MQNKILIATNNEHKIGEIKEILNKLSSNLALEFITPLDLNIDIEPEENFDTLEENAKIKAVEFYSISRIPTIADDSGLEIAELNGMPGVYSARFAEAHNDQANRNKVLELLKNIKNREAKFRTVIVFYDGTEIHYFVGECKGIIIDVERGSNGFGYDSIFVPNGFEKTFAEMTQSEKNSISHRNKAVIKFCQWIINKY
jgi:XTP/dITP diphosphohydrolase